MNVDVPLGAGERLLWSDRPHGMRGFLGPADLFLGAFALFGAFFFLVSTLAFPRTVGSFAIVSFFFPLVFFGLFFLAPRLISAARDMRGVSYTLTDRRIVLHSRRRDIEFDLAGLQHLELERSWLSRPVIFFGPRSPYEGWGGFYGSSPAPAIRGIPDADRVYRLISETRGQALKR